MKFFLRSFRPRPQIPVDVTPPTTPGTLAVTLIGQSPHLAWGASTDNVGVTGYQIWCSIAGGAYTLLAEIAPGTTYDDAAAILAATLYAYKVRAFDAARNYSSFSNIDSTTTPGGTADVTPPAVPTGLAGTHTSTSVQLTWNASTDPTVGGAVTSGTKEYVLKESGVVIATIAAGSPLSYNHTGRVPGTAYHYTIAARDNALNISADSSTVDVTTDASSPDKFPRLAAIAVNGSGSMWSGAAQTQMKNRHITLTPFYRGWTNNNAAHGLSKKQIQQNVKAASTLTNPPRMVPHIIWSDVAKAPGSPTAAVGDGPWWNYCINNNWLLYTNGLSPSTANAVNSFYSSSSYHCNNSTFTAPVAGKRSWEYFVDFCWNFLVGGTDPTSGDPADPIDRAAGNDGVFCDAIWTYLDKAGDWNINGTSDPAHVSHVDQPQDQWVRDGMAAYLTYLRTKFGGNAYIAINLINPMQVYQNPSVAGLTGGLADVALAESCIGLSSSEDTFGGSSYVMQGYIACEQVAPVIIHHDGFVNTTTGQDYLSTLRGDPNFQAERYGLTECAMRNGYYANTTNQNYNIDNAWDFDEFYNGGHSSPEWWGNPSANAAGNVQIGPTQNGIWRRDFENVIVLHYPRTATGNVATVDTTSRTITLGGTFYKCRGTRDTVTNDASAVTQITFTRDRNGMVLSRTPT